MAKEETRQEHSTHPVGSKFTQVQFAETGKKVGNAALQAQSEFLKTLEEMSRHWVACATGEIELGLKLSKKLGAAHSVPDAMAACQEWLGEEMNARAEDARRFMSEGQKFVDTSARLLTTNWSTVGAL
jgi:hypothetical protein